MNDLFSEKLIFLYGEEKGKTTAIQLGQFIENAKSTISSSGKELWDEKDVFMIAYPNSFTEKNILPLKTLNKFLETHLVGVFDGVHILPFFPYSSDRGFSIADYYQVKKEFGGWEDIQNIARKYRLMADFVLNHVSVRHIWFREFLKGNQAFRDYFIWFKKEAIPTNSIAKVYRSRATPLLTPFQTSEGERFVWTTFSVENATDQVDLNYKNPDVLLEMIKILLYLVEKGVRVIRLDAVGFIWKEIGTDCFNLPQAHTIVQLFRAVLDDVCPSAHLITQTSTSHAANVSYFGDGVNEAQLIYNFALPPLVLHAFYKGDVSYLTSWAKGLKTPAKSTAFFNFLAVHDGIGLAGAKGVLPDEEIGYLCKKAVEQGALLAARSGGEVYEINTTWWSALNNQNESFEVALKKFITSLAISLSLAGIPAVYYHSLFGSLNDFDGYTKTGVKRDVNRKNFDFNVLEKTLQNSQSKESTVFNAVKNLVQKRKSSSVFHPNARQEILDLDKRIFTVFRTGEEEKMLCLHNVSNQKVEVEYEGRTFILEPFSFFWELI